MRAGRPPRGGDGGQRLLDARRLRLRHRRNGRNTYSRGGAIATGVTSSAGQQTIRCGESGKSPRPSVDDSKSTLGSPSTPTPVSTSSASARSVTRRPYPRWAADRSSGPDRRHRDIASGRVGSRADRGPPGALGRLGPAASGGDGPSRGWPPRRRSQVALPGRPPRRSAGRCQRHRRGMLEIRAVRQRCRRDVGLEASPPRQPTPLSGWTVSRQAQAFEAEGRIRSLPIPLMTPSSPQAVHRHSIDGGTSARNTAKWPGHGRRPGRRRHGSALTHACPP